MFWFDCGAVEHLLHSAEVNVVMKRSDVFFTVALVPLDYLVLIGSFLLAYFIRTRFPSFIPEFLQGPVGDALSFSPEVRLVPFAGYVNFIFITSFVLLVMFGLTGLYKIRRFQTVSQSSAQLLRSLAAAFFAFVTITFALGSTVLPRLVIIYAFVLTTIFMFLIRVVVRLIRRLLLRRGVGVLRIGLVGDGTVAQRAKRFIVLKHHTGYRLAQEFSGDKLREIERAIKRRTIDELVVANRLSSDELIRLRELCVQNRVGFMFIPSLIEVLSTNVAVRDIQGLPVIEVPITPLEGWGFVVKRLVDIVGSIILLIILSPIYLLLALAIYFDNPGPIFFKHERLGQNLRPFKLYKFRTMKQEFCDGDGNNVALARRRFADLLDANPDLRAEWEQYQKLKQDPRVTRLGIWLRRLSLDELPQFINVLKGDVSLVGPRPIVIGELDKYGSSQHRLAAIKPGVTGLWQVSGRNDTTYEERVRLDMIYVETWSVWLDAVIMWRTMFALIFRSGAY